MMPRVLPFDPADPGLTPPIRTPRCVLGCRRTVEFENVEGRARARRAWGVGWGWVKEKVRAFRSRARSRARRGEGLFSRIHTTHAALSLIVPRPPTDFELFCG